MGFIGGSEVKNLLVNAGDSGSSPGAGKSPGEGNGNSLQYSCLENLMDIFIMLFLANFNYTIQCFQR